jgi:sugar/nucleoside kinase (ribokinase family)
VPLNDFPSRVEASAEDHPEITVIGDLNYDTIYTSPALEAGREVLITGFSREIAGAAGYAACGMARLGARVRFLTELGDDEDGRALAAEAARRGISTEGVRLLPGRRSPFTLIFAEVSEAQPRQVATFQGTLTGFTVRPGDFEAFVLGSRLLYSDSYFIMPALRADIGEAFRRARAEGILTAYDANGGDGWGDPASLRTLADRIYPHTDVIFLNAAEAAAFTGSADPLRAAEAVEPKGAVVVVKCGAEGVVLREGGRITRVGAFPLAGAVRDTVGAGDSFAAAFLTFRLRGFSGVECALLGAANAASTVLAVGGTAGQLDPAALAAFIRRYRITAGDGLIRVEV